jgi:hypothetical protein
MGMGFLSNYAASPKRVILFGNSPEKSIARHVSPKNGTFPGRKYLGGVKE